MSARRRKSDVKKPFSSWRRIPHYILYPAVGFFLGLGSPIGAFIMRYWLAEPMAQSIWMRAELRYNLSFYVYMGVGTVAAFMLFGYALGLRSEVQRIRNQALSKRIDELRLKSVTDSLTGAYTHGYLQELLELELQHCLRSKIPLSVLMLDIDDFKKINDGRGHLFGDRVIKETSETITANIRAEDILGRYGGDEFLVIMPGADKDIARRIAERICGGIAQNGYLATVSIGAATFAGHGQMDALRFLGQADANLYRAKREGKNQVNASESAQKT